MRRLLLVLALLICSLVACHVTPPPAPIPRSSIVQAVAAKSVVLDISVDESHHGTCSGTWVGKDLILTAAHCLEGTIAYRVEGSSTQGATTVVKFDETNDLALLRASEPKEHLVAALGADPARGDEVCAMGAPLGFDFSYSCGVVSHTDRRLDGDGRMLQATTPISPGSSGGGLFNADGDLVGVSDGVISSRRVPVQAINLFVHVAAVRSFLGALP